MKPTELKLKTCKVCKEKFAPRNTIQPVCYQRSCMETFAIAHAEKVARVREKRERLALREAKERSKPLKKWLDEAQVAVNRWVREVRDAHLPCISCGRYADSYDAGHYRSRGAASHLRFHEDNIHKQCSRPCNHDLSGNIVEYRRGLLLKIGRERLEALENNNETRKWTIEEAKTIKKQYTDLWKQAKKEKANEEG